MKLLVISNMYPSQSHPSYGVFVENFCAQLQQLGVAYRLCAMRRHTGPLQKILGYGRFYLESFFLCLFGRWDAVYVHYASHSSPGVLLARRLRKFPIYTNVHGSDVIPESAFQEEFQRFARRILRLSQKVIVPSPYFAACVARKYDLPMEKIAVYPSGGVDENLFHPREKTPSPVFTFGFVGRIAHGKGWETLLRACAIMPDTNYRLLLAGDGPEREAMEAMVRQLGLADRVTLLGAVPHRELPMLYTQMDVFLFPTRRIGESLGLVALEAMACGVPVIASDFAAPGDYVRPGINGEKFPPSDYFSLRDAMVAFRAMPKDRLAALSQGALATAAQYARPIAARQLKEILNL